MQNIYTDGACKGNGKQDSAKDGGWGVFFMADNHARCVWGYEADTTNNRVELIAIIQALTLSDPNRPTTIYSDSEINVNNCKKCQDDWENKGFKNGKDYKGGLAANIDLIKQVNALLKGRTVTFVKVEGHSGDTGNEMADVLSNLGALQKNNGDTTLPIQTNLNDYLTALSAKVGQKLHLSKTKSKNTAKENQDKQTKIKSTAPTAGTQKTNKQNSETPKKASNKKPKAKDDSKPASKNTAPKPKNREKTRKKPPSDAQRLLIFDTETTGLYPYKNDRIVEIGVLEMVDGQLTGNKQHHYLNPEQSVPKAAFDIHGLDDAFLADKPLFADIAKPLYDFIAGATLVAHNAAFDMAFLIKAFDEAGLPPLLGQVDVIDTLALAKAKYPNKSVKLDALVKYLEVPPRDRSYHGALLDSEILADVYVAMTADQALLADENHSQPTAFDLAALYRDYYNTAWQGDNETLSFTSDDGTHMFIPAPTERGKEERWLIFDTETTGFDPKKGDRIVEIGVVELVGRKPTGNRLHLYLNPERSMPEEAFNIHGLSDEFLADKPLFADIAKPLYDFMAGAHLIAHNAEFDMNFMVAEFANVGFLHFDQVVTLTDSLALARRQYAGQNNKLDALVKRLGVVNRDRSYHGALLDSEILADVYLAMTGGQTALDIDERLSLGVGQESHALTDLQKLLVHSVRDDDGDSAWRQSVLGYTS